MRTILETNVLGTAHLVTACLSVGFEAFVNSGSSSEYGCQNHAPSETERLEPNSEYAVAKASATLFCRYAARNYHAPIVTLRLYSVYGPYEEPRRLISTLIVRGLAGDLPPLTDPAIARDYVYTEDVSEAFIRCAVAPLEPRAVYNVGTGVQTTLSEVVEVARRALRIAAEPRWGTMPNRAWDTTVWVADSRRLEATLGWRPRVTFEAGFIETVAWLGRREPWRSFYEHRIRAAP